MTESVNKKKKANKVVPNAQLHIQASFNNTIVTLSDKLGNVLIASSAGANGFRGSKKSTAYAAQIASENVLESARDKFKVKTLEVFIKGVGLGRDSAIRAISNYDILIDSIKDVTPIPHGGVRMRRERRG